MKCGALIILVFSLKREFTILDANTMKVLFTSDTSGRFKQGTIAKFDC